MEPLRLLVDPRSSRKFRIAVSRSFLDVRSSLSGRRWRDICFGSRSGFPSTKSPSASIGIAKTTFSNLFDSSSGYAKMNIVIQWANPTGVRDGTIGAE